MMSGEGIIADENPQQCDECGKIAELRPYGKNDACICFECGMEDEKTATEKFKKHMEINNDQRET